MSSHREPRADRRFVQPGLLRRNGADPAALDHFLARLLSWEADPPITG